MTHEQKSNRKNESKEWIVDALLELMEEKPYREITVTELSARADLSRRTFYRHFDTVEDVLLYVMGQMVDDYIASRQELVREKRNLRKMVVVHFRFWETKKDFLLLLQKNNLFHMMMQILWRDINDWIRQENYAKVNPYVYSFAAGGVWHMMEKWLEEGAVKTPEEMGDVAEDILRIFV